MVPLRRAAYVTPTVLDSWQYIADAVAILGIRDVTEQRGTRGTSSRGQGTLLESLKVRLSRILAAAVCLVAVIQAKAATIATHASLISLWPGR